MPRLRAAMKAEGLEIPNDNIVVFYHPLGEPFRFPGQAKLTPLRLQILIRIDNGRRVVERGPFDRGFRGSALLQLFNERGLIGDQRL